MNDFNWKIAALTFIFYILVDALYVVYTKYIQKNKAIPAATVGAAMYGLFGFGTLAVVSSPWNILFIILGSWIGTYVTVKYYKDK